MGILANTGNLSTPKEGRGRRIINWELRGGKQTERKERDEGEEKEEERRHTI